MFLGKLSSVRSFTQSWKNIEIMHTVNSEIFARILFSRKALKDIFVMFELSNLGVIYLYMY